MVNKGAGVIWSGSSSVKYVRWGGTGSPNSYHTFTATKLNWKHTVQCPGHADVNSKKY